VTSRVYQLQLQACQGRLVQSEAAAADIATALAAAEARGEARTGEASIVKPPIRAVLRYLVLTASPRHVTYVPARAAEMVSQLEAALDELTFVKTALEAAQAEVETGRAALAAAHAARAAAQKEHADALTRLAAAEEAAQRGQEAEDALAKQEDKKRRDLENLKKQNERIALIQKAAAEAERVSEEKIGDLKAAMEGLAAKAERLEQDAAGRAQVSEPSLLPLSTI